VAEEKGQTINYAILALVVITLIISAYSLVAPPAVDLPENIATTDDLAGMATKSDLVGLATKSDLNAIESDLANLQSAVEDLGGAIQPTTPTGEVVVEAISAPLGTAGTPTNVAVTFRNPGGEVGTGSFNLMVGTQVVQVVEPVVDPYSVSTLQVPVTMTKGNHEISVNGMSDALIVMGSPPDQYEQAALTQAAEMDRKGSSQTLEQIEKEYVWFAHATEPYRGTTIRTIIEDQPYAQAELLVIFPTWEAITGIPVDSRITDSLTTTQEMAKELETQAGAYDFISVDTDMNPMMGRRGGLRSIGEIIVEFPEATNPWLDYPDFMHGTLITNLYNGELLGIPQSTGMGGFMYLGSWVNDPEEKAGFLAEYGYEMKDPLDMDTYEWTWEVYRDYLEWFTRPEEEMWGYAGFAVKMMPDMTYQYFEDNVHCIGALSQLVDWPEIPADQTRDAASWDNIVSGRAAAGEKPPSLWITRPYSHPVPVGYALPYGTEPVGVKVADGGNVDGIEMQYYNDFMVDVFHNYAHESAFETDPLEQILANFGTGKFWCIGPTWAGLLSGGYVDTAAQFDIYTCRNPVSKYWYEGMPIGHDDLSQWSMTGGTKNPQATWLFLQFSMSKSNELLKCMETGINPMRMSTMEAMIAHPDYANLNEAYSHMWDILLTDWHWNQVCTDPALWDRPGYMDATYPPVADGWREKWSGERIATEVAENLEDLLNELGYLRPDLRGLATREPWRGIPNPLVSDRAD
jgi:hypothetical protein